MSVKLSFMGDLPHLLFYNMPFLAFKFAFLLYFAKYVVCFRRVEPGPGLFGEAFDGVSYAF